jgi:hypothetical protein
MNYDFIIMNEEIRTFTTENTEVTEKIFLRNIDEKKLMSQINTK